MQEIKIVLADDHELFREGILFLLKKVPAFKVLYQAESGDVLLERLSTDEQPDVILMDLNMPGTNGVETTKTIRKQYANIKVIALTSYYSDSFINNMLEYGASSFLSKDTNFSILETAIKEVYEKGYYYNDDILKVISNKIKYNVQKTLSKFDKDHLSKREVEILQLICHQLTTTEIANKLFISDRTVEWHRNNLLLKTDAKNMVGLLIYALEHSIVSIDELLLPDK